VYAAKGERKEKGLGLCKGQERSTGQKHKLEINKPLIVTFHYFPA